ncbi:Crp/Fnr family transcriptional regulator [Flagellimonas pacifica]|uniref:cAMP-binding domain of CRP or a regulatory subunit of cAMP-dependent protein kinases n=1 Tax=Flagellimonas pacifica TaxID=1247520 RepID=A0A285MUP6_9FLAO|nr:Crp/Fnr family transcriptional regulator [Allomuricauda parva]SNZ00920.1 cAMP-binding domain of CRP or a regulatory subunit of cAMP-dependent protein kinases [Allomuricauda parva]
MQNLLQTISTRAYVSVPLKETLQSCFKLVETQKGDKILLENNRAGHLYFIEKGVLHNYYFHNGKQITSWFYTENQFVTAWYSFYAQKPSFEEIECLEDCALYRISYSDYQKLIADFPAFGNFARLLAEEMLAFLDEFSKGWSFLSAKEKYQLLKHSLPQLELRVKLGLIASFLGVTQETLSRIRAQK